MSVKSDETQNVFGAYDAWTHFSRLLQRVEKGEEMTITRHGSPVARLVPIRTASTQASRRVAIEEMRRLQQSLSLRGLKVKDLKAEGRP
jgi:prevent-host-death family protein